MASKISLNQLAKIFPNRFETGTNKPVGKVPPTADPKKPGVIQIPSRITNKDPNDVLHVAMTPRKTVLVVTPFMSEDPAKASLLARYARRCTHDSIKRGEAPIASQVFYYDVLNMNVPIERDWGLQSMLSWTPSADLVCVYIDFGVTQAMQVLINTAQLKSRKLEYRIISKVA